MEIKPWMQNLTPDNMPNDELQVIAEFLGVDFAIKLMELMPGCVINVPKYGFRKAREDYIAQNYDGTKMSRIKLSLECDVSESYIRRIVQKYKIKQTE